MDLNQTVIYATHDEVEAMSMSDKVLILKEGRIQQISPPVEIYNKPVNLFVARFIGKPTINLIESTMIEKDNEAYLDTGEFTVDVNEIKEYLKDKSSGSELILGIRPLKVLLSKEKVNENSFQGEVYVTEPLGAETIVEVKRGNIILLSKMRGEPPFNMGDKIWISLDKDAIHIFDKKTGLSLM